MIIEATTRAVNFAHRHGVTLIAAAGNESTTSATRRSTTRARTSRRTRAHERTIDNGCLSMPSEAPHVLDVSSVGPVNPASSPYPRKAFYSNYGVEQTVVAAPGGDSREFFGTPQFNAPENRILAAYPLNVAQACGEVDANGVPNGTTLCDAVNPGTSSRARYRWCATAPTACAPCTNGSRAPRWRRRTRSASRR